MTELNLGIYIFVAIVVIFSTLFNLLVKRIFLSSVLTSLFSSIVFFGANYLQAGYVDPFFGLGFFITLIIGFFVSIILQFILSEFKSRRKQYKQKGASICLTLVLYLRQPNYGPKREIRGRIYFLNCNLTPANEELTGSARFNG